MTYSKEWYWSFIIAWTLLVCLLARFIDIFYQSHSLSKIPLSIYMFLNLYLVWSFTVLSNDRSMRLGGLQKGILLPSSPLFPSPSPFPPLLLSPTFLPVHPLSFSSFPFPSPLPPLSPISLSLSPSPSPSWFYTRIVGARDTNLTIIIITFISTTCFYFIRRCKCTLWRSKIFKSLFPQCHMYQSIED